MTPQLQHDRDRIKQLLDRYLPTATTHPQALHQAMRYAVFNGGKRLRPLLLYATGRMLNASMESLDAPAAAVELIHCYSLVHDDLPAMDDDDWRRNQPACHKMFNEGTAILVGDALQSLAFACLPDGRMATTLARAIGSQGMAGGQALDLEAKKTPPPNAAALEHIHHLKTGSLIVACVELALLAAQHTVKETAALTDPLKAFAQHLGLAFQLQNDLADETPASSAASSPETKKNYNAHNSHSVQFGIPATRKRCQQAYAQALTVLQRLDPDLDTHELQQLITHFRTT